MLLSFLEKSGREIYLLMLLDISGGGLIPESMGKGFSLRAFRPVEIFPQLADGAIFERLHGVDGYIDEKGYFLVGITGKRKAHDMGSLGRQLVDGMHKELVGFLLNEGVKCLFLCFFPFQLAVALPLALAGTEVIEGFVLDHHKKEVIQRLDVLVLLSVFPKAGKNVLGNVLSRIFIHKLSRHRADSSVILANKFLQT